MRQLTLVALLLVGCTAFAAPTPTEPPASFVLIPFPTFPPRTEPPPASFVLVPFPTFGPRPYACVSTTELCYPRVALSAERLVDQYDPTADSYSEIVRLHQYDRFGIFIAGHAFTSMGGIVQWQPGDDVVVYGKHYTVFDAIYVLACVQGPPPPPARVYLMTSVNSESCESGLHQNIVVMAR